MSLIEMNWNPSERQLRQFGWLHLLFWPLVAWLWFGTNGAMLFGSIIVGGVLAVIGFFQPMWLKPIFIGLTLLTRPIGLVIGEILLGIVFFVIITPIGCVRRMLGHDPLVLHRKEETESYWRKRAASDDLRRYRRMF